MLRAALLLVLPVVSGAWKTCSITDHNAKGDGKTFDTDAVDAALKDCAGGGVVVVPAGKTYLSGGGHVLGNNQALEVQEGATLLLTNDLKQQPANGLFITAANVSNVSIYGSGSITGPGSATTCWNWGGGKWARMMYFDNVKTLRIEGVAIKQPCQWVVHPHMCDDVIIRNISISCDPLQYHYNTDGIDADSCTNMLIEDVNYTCGDDAVAIKAMWPGCKPSKNITIRRLHSGGRGGFTLGSEIQGGVEDITFEDCTSTGASGIRISQQVQRGGYIRNVNFRNITFDWGNHWAFQKKSVMMGAHQTYPAGDGGAVCPGYLKQPNMTGVHFKDLTVLKAPAGLTIGNVGCDVPAAGEGPFCTDITFDNISFINAPTPKPFTCNPYLTGSVTNINPPSNFNCTLKSSQA